VVAGVDGSAAALTATRFAACEARARAAPLVLMHATSSGETDRQRDTVLERAAAAAAAAAPGVEIVRRTSGWSPLAALLAASRDAAMLVVGLAGRDDPPEAADESVALDVLGRAGCPVAVVRAPHLRRRNVVVAAPTDIECDARVLAEATTLAARRGVPLIIDHVDGEGTDLVLDRATGAIALVLGRQDGPARYDEPARIAVHRGPCPVVVVRTAERTSESPHGTAPGRPAAADGVGGPG
jgi:nucleotide-binding universal stress UspA family protein